MGLLENYGERNGNLSTGRIFAGGDASTFSNCYYLEGIGGIKGTMESNTISFVKTSTDEETMTSEKVVKAFNDYIDAHLNDEDTATNTSDWLRWRVGENELPELIFEE